MNNRLNFEPVEYINNSLRRVLFLLIGINDYVFKYLNVIVTK